MKINEIVLAGGCFWGVEAYFKKVNGVKETEVGYANGETETTNYQIIGKTGHAEAVRIKYDKDIIKTEGILEYFFAIIDPTLKNRQGNDIGPQYRTGIYYENEEDRITGYRFLNSFKRFFKEKLQVELLPLKNFILAEEYHQNYLEKNPSGYCHVNINEDPKDLIIRNRKKLLDKLEYQVTSLNGTEPPYQNKYSANFQEGIYVDTISGEPLFLSEDKFDSSCGWPSFSKPLAKESLQEKIDKTHGMYRTEVRSIGSDSHLGHVFTDGPKEMGGLRYCINSASIRFIPLENMEKDGYGSFLPRK